MFKKNKRRLVRLYEYFYENGKENEKSDVINIRKTRHGHKIY